MPPGGSIPTAPSTGWSRRSMRSGAVTLSDVPFKPGTDFSVFDHLKYIGISTQTFTVPKVGTVTFEVDIAASTPGATAGHVVHGVYGPPGSWSLADPDRPALHRDGARGPAGGRRAQHDRLLHRPALRLVRLRRIGVPAHRAAAHLRDRQHEQPRLPRRHGGRARQGLHPDHQEHPAHAGPDPPRRDLLLAQCRSVQRRLRARWPGRRHGHQRRHPARPAGQPVRGRAPTRRWAGREAADQINSLSIGHGLFSLLDAFPFQYGCSPATTSPGAGACSPESAAYSVSLSPAERSFGQGAEGVFSGFRVTTTGR